MLVGVLVTAAAGVDSGRQELEYARHAQSRRVLDAVVGADEVIEEVRIRRQVDVNIRASYGASSAQGQAVANGLPADGVILNTGNDINDLVHKGLYQQELDKQQATTALRLELRRRLRAPGTGTRRR